MLNWHKDKNIRQIDQQEHLEIIFRLKDQNNIMMIRILYRQSQFLKKVPIVNFENFLNKRASRSECDSLRQAFYKYSCAIIKDPRVSQQKNEVFIDTLEKYFAKRQDQLDKGIMVDVYPQKEYEVGFSPPYLLKAKDHEDMAKVFTGDNAILTPFPSKPLSKLRYLWNIGQTSQYIAQNVVPKDFPQLQHIFNDWGTLMLDSIATTSEMLAISWDLPQKTLSSQLVGGANKLAPNANDLRRCYKGEPFTGIHYDFSYMTIHGRSRYPGLFVWLPNGQKLQVNIPKGHLFIQAGSQLEYLTGGSIKSGFHEAINTPKVQQCLSAALKEGKSPWRITSTMFTHINSKSILEPLDIFTSQQIKKKYPSIKQIDYMMQEIGGIRAKKNK